MLTGALDNSLVLFQNVFLNSVWEEFVKFTRWTSDPNENGIDYGHIISCRHR